MLLLSLSVGCSKFGAVRKVTTPVELIANFAASVPPVIDQVGEPVVA